MDTGAGYTYRQMLVVLVGTGTNANKRKRCESKQWRISDFVKGGGRAKDARFEAPEAPMRWSVGRGCAPSPEIKKKIWSNVFQKFLRSGQGGGASPSAPPLNTPLSPSNHG